MIDLVDRAVGFAARAHQCQRRKIGDVPYIAHPVAVAMILLRMGCDETVVAAGLLHDTVEDTPVTMDEIRQLFGDEVGDIVAGCTEPPKKGNRWETRKLHMIESLRDASLAVKLVSAADKYHNLSHTRYNERLRGASVWKKIGRNKEEQAWYYRAVLVSLLANTPEADSYPIFAMLSDLVDELFDGINPRPPR
jgi:(p)ppGpp synthase/HD superfamily hydrolase